MNNSYMHYLLKININLSIKLKMFTNSNVSFITDFISKKKKLDV